MNKKALKVCLIAPIPPPYGGIGNWVILLQKYVQNRADIILDIVSTAPRGRSIDGRNIWERVILQGMDMLKKSRALKKIIKNNRPDIIHVTTSGQLAIIRDIMMLRIAKKNGIKSFYHIRFGRIKAIAEAKTVEWRLISRAIKLATTTIAIDNTTYNAIIENIPSSKVVCVPNPIDPSKLPLPIVKTDIKKTVIFLGWVVKTKGVEELITVWNEIYKKHKDWELNIVGPCKEDYYDYLKKTYSHEGIIFSGEKNHEEAMGMLSCSDIFVLPSYTEGFPNVLLEAMVYSKPIIASEVGAIADILDDNCGLLIPPKETEGLIKALELLIQNNELREEIGRLGNEKVYKKYSIDVVFNHYKQIWGA